MQWYKIFSDLAAARSRLKDSRPQRVQIGHVTICLVMMEENFFAVQDACTHSRASLSNGWVNQLGEIICPWHNYRFELKSGTPCDSSCASLRTYPVKWNESGFYIGV